MSEQTQADGVRKGYHHGSLKEALIDAAQILIAEKGPEGFSMADACRAAGVSTAAPYRHFADRGALVEAVALQGFEKLADQLRPARDSHPAGTVESIVAMGQAYVGFAEKEPAQFKLMFSCHPAVQPDGQPPEDGKPCFMVVLEAVAAWFARQGETSPPEQRVLNTALMLWTIVHGTAYLLLDNDFDAIAPETDTDMLVNRATRALLGGLAAIGEET